jgi:hypothetical protein
MGSVIPIIQGTSPSHSFSVCVYLNIHVHILTRKLCCRYGTYLSKEQVTELVAPHLDTLELVGPWLALHEVPSSAVSITHGGRWLTIYQLPLTQQMPSLVHHTNSSATQRRTRWSFAQLAIRCPLPCTRTCRRPHQRRTSVCHEPSGKCRNWC